MNRTRIGRAAGSALPILIRIRIGERGRPARSSTRPRAEHRAATATGPLPARVSQSQPRAPNAQAPATFRGSAFPLSAWPRYRCFPVAKTCPSFDTILSRCSGPRSVSGSFPRPAMPAHFEARSTHRAKMDGRLYRCKDGSASGLVTTPTRRARVSPGHYSCRRNHAG